jgi:hypothetical protein
MEANEKTYQLFDNYLSGNLSGDEKNRLEKTLSENDSLRDEFIWMSSAVNSIRMSGNQIFKKQIAEIGMGIPSSALEKYSPSIKPKNFFRKYWWAITAGSAIIIAVSCWFIFNKPKHPEEKKNDFAPITDSVKRKDSVIIPIKNTDSCAEDSIKIKPGVKKTHGQQGDAIDNKSGFIFGDIEDCPSYIMSVFSENKFYGDDSSKSFSASAESIVFRIRVSFCQQTTKKPFYTYDADLRIYGSYSDSTKIILRQNKKGEIIMTDGKPGYFILRKNENELLVRKFNSRAGIETKVEKRPVKPAGRMKM